MVPHTLLLAVLPCLVVPVFSRFVLEKSAFLKLPDRSGALHFDNGAAIKASYDPHTNFLYVAGHDADLLHVINMTDPNNPFLITTKIFNMVNMGLPDSIQVCRGGAGREFLAMGFESKDQLEKSHLHLFGLLDESNYQENLVNVKHHITLDGYDPKAIGWQHDCTRLLVANWGEPHNTTGGGFIDPGAIIEVLKPSFGSSTDRFTHPIDEGRLTQANVRQVFRRCDSGTDTFTRTQDLQPTALTVDSHGTAYIAFQDNNAIGKLDLTNDFGSIDYFDLGRKQWTENQWEFDGSSNGRVSLMARKGMQSLYQPGDIDHFEMDGKTYLATADTGSYRQYHFSQCTFTESVEARDWNELFADGLTSNEQQALADAMNNTEEYGNLRVSKLRAASDGWDYLNGGYDFVTTYGGRGFSILDASDMTRVYDSGDDLERYYTGPGLPENTQVTYNVHVGEQTDLVSSRMDLNSVTYGPEPSAITVATLNATSHVIIVANGQAGGLYLYSVTSGPTVQFESFQRRGQAGFTWQELYDQGDKNEDSVGEPHTSDLLYFDDENQKTVVVVSRLAGAISVYRLVEQ